MRKNIILAIALLVITTSFISAKYISMSTGTTNLSLAKPVIEIVPNDSSILQMNLKCGEELEYLFNIKNFDSTNVNEVKMQYYIQVVPQTSNLSLKYTLYNKAEDGTETLVGESETGLIEIGHTSEETHKYKLKVGWTEDGKNLQNANQKVVLDIKVVSKQII